MRPARSSRRGRSRRWCVTSLGLGMGVVIAIMLLSRMLLGTPSGVNDNGLVELVIRPSGALRAQAGTAIIDTWSYPDYLDVRDAASGMVITGWSRGEGLVQLPGQSSATSAPTMYVSSNYFSNVGVALARGRGFTAVDDASLAEPEAVIGHRAWQVRFGSDPNIIGRAITVNQTEYVVVGVAPEGFRGHINGLDDAYFQLWLPLSRHPRLTAVDNVRLSRDAAWVRVVARLSAGHDAGAGGCDPSIRHGGACPALSRKQSGQDRRGRTVLPGRGAAAVASVIWTDGPVWLGRHGAARRRPEHLGHDAGARRDARAGTGNQTGDRSEPVAPDAVSLERSVRHGRVRRQRGVRPSFRRASGRRLGVGFLWAGARSVQARCVAGPAVHCPLFCDEPGAGAAAGASLQPACDPLGPQERLRRQRPARGPLAAAHGGNASRYCRPVPRHRWDQG